MSKCLQKGWNSISDYLLCYNDGNLSMWLQMIQLNKTNYQKPMNNHNLWTKKHSNKFHAGVLIVIDINLNEISIWTFSLSAHDCNDMTLVRSELLYDF